VSHMGFVLIGIASFTDIGTSGAMLQMLSHGLIASVLFFLTGVTYDRTHTLFMDRMDGIALVMPKAFALFTAAAMASLALPGMSGFASEIAVFVGMATNDVYSPAFSTVTIFLAAVGIIITPIYLLSMLRLVFFNSNEALACDIDQAKMRKPTNEPAVCFGNSCVLPGEAPFDDANPREIFIAACFLVMIVGIGLYPKLFTQMYDLKTVAINAEVHQSQVIIAQQKHMTLAQADIPQLNHESR
jgi:NAD(P)H-quinone oxidoreductase subunit 4